MDYYPGNDLDLGTIVGSDEPLVLTRRDRARHTYLVGASRTGKTKLLEGMVLQDLQSWPFHECPLVVIDPHGTLYDGLMAYAAAEGLDQWPLVPLDLRRDDWVVSYNPLRRRDGVDPAVVCRGFVQAILHAWGQANSNDTPRLATCLEAVLMLAYERECSLIEALQIVNHPEMRRMVADEVRHTVTRTTLQALGRLRESEFQERLESTLNRVNRFLSTQVLRATLCQGGETLDLSQVLERGSILLANLSVEGTKIADEDAAALGSLLLTDLWTAARRRGKREEGALRPCYVYVDEFQNFVSPTVARGLSEASGFGLHLHLAHQYPTQLEDHGGELGRMILNSVLNNARNRVVFQVPHPQDLEMLTALLFRQDIDPAKVKDEIYSTKVVGHELTYLPSYSTSESRGTTRGWQQSHTEGQTHTTGASRSHTDGGSVSSSFSQGQSEGESASATAGQSSSRGHSDSAGVNWGESQSHTDSRSRGEGENWSASHGQSSGSASDHSRGRSLSENFDWASKRLQKEVDEYRGGRMGEETEADFKRRRIGSFTVGESESDSRSHSRGTNSSTSSGGNRSRSQGSSDTAGTSSGGSRSHTESESIGHTNSLTAGVNSSRSRTAGGSLGVSSSDTIGTNESVGEQVSQSWGESESETETQTVGQTLSPHILPVMGTELSSRQFESIPEQLFRKAQFLDGQPDRHCVVRLASARSPVQLYTRTVEPPLATADWAAQWTTGAVSSLPFASPMEQAMHQLEDRERSLPTRILPKTGVGEPETARRRVTPAPAPPVPEAPPQFDKNSGA